MVIVAKNHQLLQQTSKKKCNPAFYTLVIYHALVQGLKDLAPHDPPRHDE